MDNSNVADFRDLLETTLTMYGRECPVTAQRLWWAAMAPYAFDDVRRAFSAHLTGKRGQFAPLPADILQNLRAVSGHLSTEEAWALALESTDEAVTVVWTDEIAQALAAARPCLEAGDKFGASKAFASAYERSMQQAAPQPVWRVSLGDDKAHRIIAMEAAHKLGRLTSDQVRRLLPPKKSEGPVVALLAGKTEGLDSRWKELAEKLRFEQEERDSQADAERQRQIKEFNARRKAVLDAIEKQEAAVEAAQGGK